ncbi:MAG: 3-oxoacyl-[acyl-carrier-protein] reductase [Candidatus Omnitrophota bacterium]|nr:MAG: 3-oxoacyl-[acyl-carrier-protein] reductase [Candidatus Omnitrophota bacterium]
MMDLKGNVAIVTGAAQGIGKEIALHLAKAGAKVAIFDLNEDKLKETLKEINAVSEGLALKVDVTNLSEAEENVNKVVDKLGRVDILVNNAGITKDSLFLRLSESDWDKVLTVNLKGAFNCTKAVSRLMVKQRYGRIINISSVIGLMGNVGQANYAASKAGLIGLTKSLAKELGTRSVTVNAIAPGYIQTAMTDALDEKVKEEMFKRIPLGRFGQPSDVAKAVTFLASSEADYITGQVLVIDGGLI